MNTGSQPIDCNDYYASNEYRGLMACLISQSRQQGASVEEIRKICKGNANCNEALEAQLMSEREQTNERQRITTKNIRQGVRG